MSIFVSEPARPGPQRLPEALRNRRVNEAEVAGATQSISSRSVTEDGSSQSDELLLARRAAAGYAQEAAGAASSESPYLPVSQLVVQGVFTVDSSASLDEAKALMSQHGIHHLVVLHDGLVAGLVDLGWILERQVQRQAAAARPGTLVDEILPAFITASPETDAHELAHQMLGYQINSAIVINQKNQAIGMVTATDYLRLYAQRSQTYESN